MKNTELTNRYSTIASWVYHIDKPIGRSFGDVEYYLERLKNCNGTILEPATGNGRILIPLLERGLQVEGFDASLEMLSYCKQECETRKLKTVIKQEMFNNFSYSEPFEAIIIPAGSFQLITDTDEAIEVLKRFKLALKEGGRLIIDLSPISALAERPMLARQWNVDNGMLTLTESRVETSYLKQTTLSQLRYEHWDNEKGLINSEIDLFSLRFWGVKEFELALIAVGFTDITISSNYNYLEEPNTETHTLTFETR
ncbi:class I SAM-dependent methyltransferase [Myroides sp. M-43]|uniref:class I SAM-dependent methyltransferase n=1 Tax=Myroides oncorhynchi TaxID=2893756 RepID=UPI001E39C709|nr:class I SAM-dependent methyltransferase [Myroides oncorhynchi]MCC9044018.1 class I SAM-dependent methyltransferase [Myroides oncorhynchi]